MTATMSLSSRKRNVISMMMIVLSSWMVLLPSSSSSSIMIVQAMRVAVVPTMTSTTSTTTTTTTSIPVIQPGQKLPLATLHYGFPPQHINTASYAANKNMVIVGLPGAFTPTCSSIHVPGYIEQQQQFKAAGINEILFVCVNDGAVMRAWMYNQTMGHCWMKQQEQESYDYDNAIVSMMGDPHGELIRQCGMEITSDARVIKDLGLIGRSKRFAMIVVQNIVHYVAVSESPEDPTGDTDISLTSAETLLQAWNDIKSSLPQS